MALDVRKNAATMPAAEFENFLKACVLLKSQLVPGQTYSVYDQWVAIHACIVALRAPGDTEFRNGGHHYIGFLPWHREYLRRFELALQAVVPGATIPYWPWPMTPEPSTLFSNARVHRMFFSSSVTQNVNGLFAPAGPSAPPPWWPTGFRWQIRSDLSRPGGSPTLVRGSPNDVWPPSAATVTALENMAGTPGGANVYWLFWREVEAGPRTHNRGHNIVGGYMADPTYSPNDPLFWLHHATIDRIWARWQANRLAAGGTLLSLYPPPTEASPIDGEVPPPGHRRDDLMWPWVGTTPGYAVNVPAGVQAMVPNFTAAAARRIRDTFDIAALGGGLGGYTYA